MSRRRACFEPGHVLEIVSNDNVSFLVVVIGFGIDHEQNDLIVMNQTVSRVLESVAYASDHLLMILVGYVDVVDLNDSVAFPKTGRFSGRISVHFADMLAHFGSLGMQIESVALEIGPFLQMAQTRSGSVLIELSGLLLDRVLRVVQVVRGSVLVDAIFIVAFDGHF